MKYSFEQIAGDCKLTTIHISTKGHLKDCTKVCPHSCIGVILRYLNSCFDCEILFLSGENKSV